MNKTSAKLQHLTHEFEPIFNEKSRVLILGTFPSVKSREQNFYYGHPQNRFWKVLSAVFKQELPVSVTQKKEFLLQNGIAVWDVIGSCMIEGSSDSSIRDVVPNDISVILEKATIEKILANGAKSYELYEKYMFPICKKEAIKMPSTSPANAAWSVTKLCEAYEKELSFLK